MAGRRRFKIRWLILLFLILWCGAFIYNGNTDIEITEYEVASDKLPAAFDGYKIVLLSDLHSAEYGEKNKKLMSAIMTIAPDAVFAAGDMMNSKEDDGYVFESLVRLLKNKIPVYYILGNHEQIAIASKGDPGALKEHYDKLREYEVIALDNRKITLAYKTESIDLYGLWFNLRYYRDKSDPEDDVNVLKAEDVTRILGEPEPSRFNLLLTHNPVYFSAYEKWGATLVLAGHMHGGMINIPGKGGLLSPERELFPGYTAGRYTLTESTMIVSRGLGNGNAGIRINNKPEIVVVTLKRNT